ncbi:hypothetical protein EXIGLDRAFT_794513 [Exidia glandulosa HHB12029]|uniref:Uncharacterized protein n=1 Tax=Exidia glandulosa HHB12029 TaxID=1314781 RepID=A0A165NHW0_EXIGL|nr:hypothetical protein EXIGLDRAFT_794513 [Exidia glandulosa HHB12029]
MSTPLGAITSARDNLSSWTWRRLTISNRNQDLIDRLEEGEEVLTVVERNARREKRRKAGDKEVSDDEAEGVEGLLENLSAAVAKQTSENAEKEKKAKEPAKRIVRAGELKSRLEADTGAIPEALLQHWDNRLHIPLTALTANAIRSITRSEGLKYTTISTIDGTKKVLDTSTFPAEASMNEASFRDGWANYLRLIRLRCDMETFRRIGGYYTRLSTHREFNQSFPAFLAFDIENRTDFANNPFTFDGDVFIELPMYIAKLSAAEAKSMIRESLPSSSGHQGKSQLVERQPHRAPSFEPYPQVRHSSSSSSDLSQQFSSSASGQDSARGSFRDRKDFLGRCLSCGRDSHKATKCFYNTSKDGGQLFAVWRGQNLVELNNISARICIPYNSSRGCSHSGTEHAAHCCSLCGMAEHGAYSTNCRRN